jgi:hypothetical protein
MRRLWILFNSEPWKRTVWVMSLVCLNTTSEPPARECLRLTVLGLREMSLHSDLTVSVSDRRLLGFSGIGQNIQQRL